MYAVSYCNILIKIFGAYNSLDRSCICIQYFPSHLKIFFFPISPQFVSHFSSHRKIFIQFFLFLPLVFRKVLFSITNSLILNHPFIHHLVFIKLDTGSAINCANFFYPNLSLDHFLKTYLDIFVFIEVCFNFSNI